MLVFEEESKKDELGHRKFAGSEGNVWVDLRAEGLWQRKQGEEMKSIQSQS